MKILVLNCGSSSVKYKLINIDDGKLIAQGSIERIGLEDAIFKYTAGKPVTEKKEIVSVKNHEEAIKLIICSLIEGEHKVISGLSEISAVGHRIVHGGEKFSKAVIIDDKVKKDIFEYFDLAPLHNPHNYKGVEVSQQLLPGIPHVAVFDTAFHQTMPPESFFYAIPYYFYEKYGIRKYGFHGASHYYVANRAAAIMKKEIEDLKIITCHLGNGASMAAIRDGKSVDTSMGFTPLEGLVMGTRCGDMDPAILQYMMDVDEITIMEVNTILNSQSGLFGLSGISSDMRDVIKAAGEKNKRAQLAIAVFVRRIKKYIGSYASVMNGLDVLVFTAGIGENNAYIRELCLTEMDYLGIAVDRQKNESALGKESLISSGKSRVSVYVIPTNEEMVIAQECKKLLA